MFFTQFKPKIKIRRTRGRYLSLVIGYRSVIAAIIGLVRSLKHLVIECVLSQGEKRTIRSTNLCPLDRLHFSLIALRNRWKFRRGGRNLNKKIYEIIYFFQRAIKLYRKHLCDIDIHVICSWLCGFSWPLSRINQSLIKPPDREYCGRGTRREKGDQKPWCQVGDDCRRREGACNISFFLHFFSFFLPFTLALVECKS